MDRDWLQRERATGPADEDVHSQAHAGRRLGPDAAISPRQCPARNAGRRGDHAPNQMALVHRAERDAELVDTSEIGLGQSPFGGVSSTSRSASASESCRRPRKRRTKACRLARSIAPEPGRRPAQSTSAPRPRKQRCGLSYRGTFKRERNLRREETSRSDKQRRGSDFGPLNGTQRRRRPLRHRAAERGS